MQQSPFEVLPLTSLAVNTQTHSITGNGPRSWAWTESAATWKCTGPKMRIFYFWLR